MPNRSQRGSCRGHSCQDTLTAVPANAAKAEMTVAFITRSQTDGAILSLPLEPSLSMLDPDSHAWLKGRPLADRIEAQPQRVAVVIANHPLGLPGGEGSEWLQFGDDRLGRGIGTVPQHVHRLADRETTEVILACVERKPLLAGRLDHQDRLARANALADFPGDDACA